MTSINTPNNSTQDSDQTNTQETTADYGVPTLSNGIFRLWEVAADNLSDEQLEFFDGFADEAERECGNIAKIVMDIGCLVGADENAENFRGQDSVSTLLFSLSHQLDVISGMLLVGHSASDRLKHPELYKKSHKETD